MTFYVDEGPKTRIRKVTVDGNTVFSARKIKAMMKKTRGHWLGSLVTRKDVYTEGRFAEDVDAIRSAYEELGYIDVLVDEPELNAQRTGGGKPRVWYDLHIHIQEGPRYTMGALTFQGNEVLEESKMREQFPVKQGDALNKVALEGWLKGVEQGYGARGYIYATAGPVFTRNPDNSADVW